MKLKLDENLPSELRDDLRHLGYEVDTVVDEGLAGVPDPVLLEHVRVDERTLLTMDKGIADVRTYPPDRYHGIVLIRPPTTGRAAVLAFMRPLLTTLLSLDLAGHMTVVSESGIRLR